MSIGLFFYSSFFLLRHQEAPLRHRGSPARLRDAAARLRGCKREIVAAWLPPGRPRQELRTWTSGGNAALLASTVLADSLDGFPVTVTGLEQRVQRPQGAVHGFAPQLRQHHAWCVEREL